MSISEHCIGRRQFIGASISLVGGAALGAPSLFGQPAAFQHSRECSRINGVQIGAITFSWFRMPDRSAKATLGYALDSRICAIELMGDTAESFAGIPKNPIDRRAYFRLRSGAQRNELTDEEQGQFQQMEAQSKLYAERVAEWRASVPMDKFVELRSMYNEAGVEIYAWKPDAFGPDQVDEEIEYAFKVARVLGATSCTTEHPHDDVQTNRLGSIAARHEIYISYHNHTDVTPTLFDAALQQSEYNAINLDVGHYVAGGNPDPVAFIRKYHDRISSIHLKDRTLPENGALQTPMGEGDTPVGDILRLMRDEGYTFPASIELSYSIPEGSNAVAEVQRCVEYCRQALNQ